eukprot:95248-Rhodomonas_salina.2
MARSLQDRFAYPTADLSFALCWHSLVFSSSHPLAHPLILSSSHPLILSSFSFRLDCIEMSLQLPTGIEH